jgi:hypothetical protein
MIAVKATFGGFSEDSGRSGASDLGRMLSTRTITQRGRRNVISNVGVRYESEFVLLETADGLLCFTYAEWSRAARRGGSIRRNQQLRTQGMGEVGD